VENYIFTGLCVVELYSVQIVLCSIDWEQIREDTEKYQLREREREGEREIERYDYGNEMDIILVKESKHFGYYAEL